MHFIIHCLDAPGALPLRLQNHPAHRAYLAEASVKIVVAGPLVADDHETMIDSCFLIEADSKDAAMAFNRHDPFSVAGVWAQVQIHPFIVRTDNRS